MKPKSENKKAMPKFILIVIASLLLGLLIGIGLVAVSEDWSAHFGEHIIHTLILAAPWLLFGSALLSALLMFLLYRKVRKLFSTWDEDDEGTLQRMDRLLSVAIQINSIVCILSYFFVAIPMSYIAKYKLSDFFLCLGGFCLNMAVMVIGQQKLVDFTKKLYPEKRGSVYDTKFQKVWFESCDEAERAIIGQAAFASYKATNTACLLIWMLLILTNQLFHFGLLPIAVVTLIWLINSVSYFAKTMQLENKKNGSNGVFPF